MNLTVCQECGTQLHNVNKCSEYFDQMIAWDFSDFTSVGKFHHLTVLCYYLQHPTHYSQEGLNEAVRILQAVVENKLSDKDLYKMESERFSSHKRSWSITGSKGTYGNYSREINWSMTVFNVVKDGITKYPERIQRWADTIYSDLKRNGQIN